MDNMPGCSYDSIKDLNSRISHTHSKKVIKHALRQQAKRRRKNTTIAAGNSNASIVVKSLPPRGEVKESTKPATMREVLASIPGFSIKPRKRSNKKLSAAAQLEQTKEGCIDLETPDSILVQTNLRALLNKHTFSSLPSLYQYKLVQLLPDVDRPGGALSDSSLRISASGLNNEFFARACLEWRERLAEGEFTPENQQKLKAEAEKEMSRLDPWKLKHFEPIWGEKQEPTADSTPLLLPSPARPSLKTTIKLRPSTSNRHPKIMPSLTRRLRTVGAVTRAITSYRDRHQEALGITEKRPVENEDEDDAQHKKLKSIPNTSQEMQQDEESAVVKTLEEASSETKTEADAIKEQEFDENNELEKAAENEEEGNKPQSEEQITENNAKEQISMSEDEIDMQEEEDGEEDEEEEEEEEEETEELEAKTSEVMETSEMHEITESRNSPELKEESQNAAEEEEDVEINKESIELSESYIESEETEVKVVEIESGSIDGENAMYEPTAIPEADVIHETAILESTDYILKKELKINAVVDNEDVMEENKENIAVDNIDDTKNAEDSATLSEGDNVEESTEKKSIKSEENVTVANGMAENEIESNICVEVRDLTETGDDMVASDRNSVDEKEEIVSRSGVEVDVCRSIIENKEDTMEHQPATIVSENEDTVVIEDSADSVVDADKADSDVKENKTAEAKMVEMGTETSPPAATENIAKTEDVDTNEDMRAVLLAAAQECCWEMVDSSTEKLLSEVPLTLPVALTVVEEAEHTEEVEVIPMQEELEVRLEEGTFPVAAEDWPYAVKMDSTIVAVTMDGGEVPTNKETQVQYSEYSTSQAVKLELEVTLTPEVVTSAESLVTSTVGGSGPNCSTAATSSSGPPPVAKASVATVIPPTTIVCLPSAVPPPNLMHRATQLAKTVASSSAVPYLSVSSNTPVRALPTQIPKSQSKSKQGSQVSSGSGGNRGSRSSSNKPPPGAVNLERSYQICQAVIQNSPNRDQLRCQLKPPPSLLAANSNATTAAVTGNGSKKSESSSRAATQYGVVTSSRNGASKPFTPPLPAVPAVGGFPVLPGNSGARNGMGTQGKVMGSRGIYQQPPPVVVRHVFTSSQGIPVTMAVLPQAQAPPEVAESPHVGQYILVQRTGVGDQVVRKGAPPPPRASSAPPSNNGGRPGGALGLGRGRPASVDVQQHGIEYVPNSYGEHFVVQCPNPGTQAITKKNNENVCGGVPYADGSDPVVQSYTIINPNTNADNQNYNRPTMPTARTAQRTDSSQCACNLKAMIMCKKCGAFCHDDCIGPSRLCVTCLIR